MGPVKECNAYCRPEEGIHIHLGWSNTDQIDVLRQAWVGQTDLAEVVDDNRWPCYPLPCWQTVVAIDPAIEAGASSPFEDAPYAFLLTVQVEPLVTQ